MKKIIFSIIIALTLILVPLASASVTEVTAEASADRVTTGTSVTITCTITASKSETTSLQLITSPPGITISDPPGGYYPSVSVSQTPTTKTFTISAGTANTYTYYAQAGSVSSTEKTIVFEDPSVLTVSGSPTSVTKNAGESFTLSIDITNSQSEPITTSYSLSYSSSDFSVSGDPTSDSSLVINAGSTKNLEWTITLDSDITTGTYTINFELGDNDDAFTVTVNAQGQSTPSTTCTTTSTPGGGGAPGGGVATTTTVGGEETTTTTVSGEETTTTVEEEKEEKKEEKKESAIPEIPGEAPKKIDPMILVSFIVFLIIIGAIAYWKKHEIFKLGH